jgi:hypothetical protein
VRDVSFLILVGLTSLAGYLVGARWLGLPRAGLAAAVGATLETIGLAVVFLGGNLGVLMLAIPLARFATGGFVPVYVVDDVTLSTVSLVQGLLFRWWWSRG